MYLIVSGVIGGVERYILDRCFGLRKRYDLKVAAGYKDAISYYRGRLPWLNTVYFLFTRALSLSLFFPLVRDLCTGSQIVLHSSDPTTALWGKLISFVLKCSGCESYHFTTIHSILDQHAIFHGLKKHLVFGAYRLLKNFEQCATVCVSAQVARSLQQLKLGGSTLPIVYHGVSIAPNLETRNRAIAGAGSTVMGFVGRLDFEKGPDRFVELANSLGADGYTALVYGDGKLRSKLESTAQGRIDFRGFVLDRVQVYSEVDVVCITSRTESYSYVLVESMLTRTAVFALDLPVFHEILGGLAMEDRVICRSIQEMKERIVEIGRGTYPYDYEELYRRAEAFSIDAETRETSALYERCFR